MAFDLRGSLTRLVMLLFLNGVSAVDAQLLNPVKNYCARYDHQSTVKDGVLYIFGGGQTFVGSNNYGTANSSVTVGYNTHLISVDLRHSWDWKVNISEAVENITANPDTGSLPPQLSCGTLFQGSSEDPKLYFYGGTTTWANTSFSGFPVPEAATYSLWAHDTTSKMWSQYDISSVAPYRPSNGAYAEAPEQSLAFYLNGEINNGSASGIGLAPGVNAFLTGMIVINTTDQTARNISTADVTGNRPRARAQMQLLPNVGQRGAIVLVGGISEAVNELDSSDTPDLVPMRDVALLDVNSLGNASTPNGVWYRQNATGTNATNIPKPRVDFCLITVSAADSSSHNIYMYGGRDSSSHYFDDIWILSLPSFTWTQVYNGQNPRFAHTCHLVGNRTLLTVGGIASLTQKSGQPDADAPPCDWEIKGVGVMDLTTIVWGSVYDSQAPAYEVPAKLLATIGGDPTGNASLTAPAAGFANEGLASLFGVQVLPKSPPRSSFTGARKAEIAAPICGVTVLCAIVGLGWWWQKPHKRNEEPEYHEKAEVSDVTGEPVFRRGGE